MHYVMPLHYPTLQYPTPTLPHPTIPHFYNTPPLLYPTPNNTPPLQYPTPLFTPPPIYPTSSLPHPLFTPPNLSIHLKRIELCTVFYCILLYSTLYTHTKTGILKYYETNHCSGQLPYSYNLLQKLYRTARPPS